MNGIARIAITIISQSRCLRNNFIITGEIVEAAVVSRKFVCGSAITLQLFLESFPRLFANDPQL